jgi:hypothetical protein
MPLFTWTPLCVIKISVSHVCTHSPTIIAPNFVQTFQVIVFSFQGPFSAYFSGRPSNERVLIFLQIRFRHIFTGILELILVHLACLIQYYLKRKKNTNNYLCMLNEKMYFTFNAGFAFFI